jgi:PHD/YefM family antitoxin component YafN of YafNO toxin-antitoxin module
MKSLHTVPLSAIDNQQQDLLALIQRGPVALTAEEQIAAVLLSPAQWAAIAQTLEAAHACLAALDASVDHKA